jgi:hypothetical protein
VCEFEQVPGFIFPSTDDGTGRIPGLVCRRTDGKLPGSTWRSTALFWKLLRNIPEIP